MLICQTWIMRLILIICFFVTVGLIRDLDKFNQFQNLNELYQGQPCRFSYPISTKVKVAIWQLRRLPAERFCNAVLFQDEETVIDHAVEEILAYTDEEMAKTTPCLLCLGVMTKVLDGLEFDYTNHPQLMSAKKYIEINELNSK